MTKSIPTTKLEDSAELIFADYDSKNITVFEAMERVDELIISERREAVSSFALRLHELDTFSRDRELLLIVDALQRKTKSVDPIIQSKSKRSE